MYNGDKAEPLISIPGEGPLGSGSKKGSYTPKESGSEDNEMPDTSVIICSVIKPKKVRKRPAIEDSLGAGSEKGSYTPPAESGSSKPTDQTRQGRRLQTKAVICMCGHEHTSSPIQQEKGMIENPLHSDIEASNIPHKHEDDQNAKSENNKSAETIQSYTNYVVSKIKKQFTTNAIAANIEFLVSLTNNTLFFGVIFSTNNIFPPPLSQQTSLQISYGNLILAPMAAIAFAIGSQKAHKCEYEVSDVMSKIDGKEVIVSRDGKEIIQFEEGELVISGKTITQLTIEKEGFSSYAPTPAQSAIIFFDFGNHALDIGAQMIIMKLFLENYSLIKNIITYGVLPVCGLLSSHLEIYTTASALTQKNALNKGVFLDFQQKENENSFYLSALSNSIPGAISLGYSIALCLDPFLGFQIKNHTLNIAYETLLIGMLCGILPAIGYAHTLYAWGFALRNPINLPNNNDTSNQLTNAKENSLSNSEDTLLVKLLALYQQCLNLYCDLLKKWASLKSTDLKLAVLGYALVTAAFLTPFVVILNTGANLSKSAGTTLAFLSFIVGGLLRTGDTKSAITFMDTYSKNPNFENNKYSLGRCLDSIFALRQDMTGGSSEKKAASALSTSNPLPLQAFV